MLQILAQSKENSVSSLLVDDVRQDGACVAVPDLEDTPYVRHTAEIETHGDQTVLAEVIVPRVEMPAAGHETVDPSVERADTATLRDLSISATR